MSGPPVKKRKFGQRKQNKLFSATRGKFLEAGQRGFLATCNFREKDCIREAFNVLNHYADELYGSDENEATKPVVDKEVESDDILDDLQKEIDALKAKLQSRKGPSKQRFFAVDTGATNCVFIRTTLLNPVELGTAIVKDVAITREQKSRFLLRLVPVEVVCHANLKDITDAGSLLFDKYFLKKGTTFAIVFNKRYNNAVHRDDVIHELAALVQLKNMDNRVDLKNAEKTIVVEVIKGLCCLSVVDGYLKYKKYNLIELANAKETNETDTKAAKEKKEEIVSIELSKDTQQAEDNKKDELENAKETNETDTKAGEEKKEEIVSTELSKDSQVAEDNKKDEPDILDVKSQTDENHSNV
ncbi:THUMP domain-containing protein 1 homolog [Anastrepha obliqua]|uniref:THUMP domain-containing protein 1 homolog n=1 Tax=Anastrepha obliqua TaxID=95512 RepID=UPI002408FB26|nr:THUMP domain-containing protein 1 homolog [Anastrepha obliqua]